MAERRTTGRNADGAGVGFRAPQMRSLGPFCSREHLRPAEVERLLRAIAMLREFAPDRLN